MWRKPTDNALIIIFFKIIPHYENSIGSLEKRLRIVEDYPPACIYDPISLRQDLGWILEFLRKKGKDVSVLEEALDPLDSLFKEIRNAHKEEYIRQLNDMFFNRIENYTPNSIIEDPTFFETDVNNRDVIESIRRELIQFIDIGTGLEDLEKKDQLFLNLIPEAIKRKTYFPMDLIEAPPEIWWRHLEEKYGEPEGIAGVPPD